MKRKYILQYCKTGFLEAKEMGLDKINNWTPLLIYIHVSRIVVGAVVGIIGGLAIGIFIGLLIQ